MIVTLAAIIFIRLFYNFTYSPFFFKLSPIKYDAPYTLRYFNYSSPTSYACMNAIISDNIFFLNLANDSLPSLNSNSDIFIYN